MPQQSIAGKLLPAERQRYLDQKYAERQAIQQKIEALRVKRAAYIAEEQNKNTSGGEQQTLDQAMSKVLRSQAQKANYTF